MTGPALISTLEELHAKNVEGEYHLPEGRRITLYAAHDGVALTVAKVESVRLTSGLVRAKNDKGDIYVLSLDDLFAASVDAGSQSASGRKAGFLG
jgi:hypothetical protein